MEIDLDKKYNYKLRNKKTGKFYSNGRKATWARPLAVVDLLKGQTGWQALKAKEWEVVLFPLEEPLVVDSADFLGHYEQRIADKKAKIEERKVKEAIKTKERKIAEEKRLLKELKSKYPDA